LDHEGHEEHEGKPRQVCGRFETPADLAKAACQVSAVFVFFVPFVVHALGKRF